MIEINKVHYGDCLELMKEIDDKSIDMILCDLPYGVTQNEKDVIIDSNYLWWEYKRILKENGVIVLTAQFPYTQELIRGSIDWFKYDLIWDKTLTTGFLNANKMPLRQHEHILVFYNKQPTYNPIMTIGNPLHGKGNSYKNKELKNQNYGKMEYSKDNKGRTEKYPTSIITIPKLHPSQQIHPTEKPVKLGEYLIKTYSNIGDLVLDTTCGVGSFLVAAKKCNRNFIGIEKEQKYVDISNKRLNEIPNGDLMKYD